MALIRERQQHQKDDLRVADAGAGRLRARPARLRTSIPPAGAGLSPRPCPIWRRTSSSSRSPSGTMCARAPRRARVASERSDIGEALLTPVARAHRPEERARGCRTPRGRRRFRPGDRARPSTTSPAPSPGGRPCRRRGRSGSRRTTGVGCRSSPTPPPPCRWRRPPRTHPASRTWGRTYIKARIPIAPPAAAPANRRIPFCVLAPTVDSDTTKQVITEV